MTSSPSKRRHGRIDKTPVSMKVSTQAHDSVTIETLTPARLLAIMQEHEAESAKVQIADGWVTLKFAYEYEIDLKRIASERDLLSWAVHLCGKTWMNADRLRIFIEKVAGAKGFNIHGL